MNSSPFIIKWLFFSGKSPCFLETYISPKKLEKMWNIPTLLLHPLSSLFFKRIKHLCWLWEMRWGNCYWSQWSQELAFNSTSHQFEIILLGLIASLPFRLNGIFPCLWNRLSLHSTPLLSLQKSFPSCSMRSDGFSSLWFHFAWSQH